MGHNIYAFIGKDCAIQKLSDSWIKARAIALKQGCSMVFLTDDLFDDFTELYGIDDELNCNELTLFTSAVYGVMQEYSKNCMLAYIETDYFGGIGTQAGVLFENGNVIIEPTTEENIINKILNNIGIYRENGKDEFDSIGLGKYRRYSDWSEHECQPK